MKHLLQKHISLLVILCFAGFTACNADGGNNHKHENGDHDHLQDSIDHHDDMHGNKADEIPSQKRFTKVNENIQQKVQNLTHSYLQVKTALVNSNPNEAAEKAQTVKKNGILLHTDGLPRDQTNLLTKHLPIIENNAEIIANNTSDIEKQREAFKDLSASLYVLAKAFGPSQTLYYQYCPMAFDDKGAYWVSTEEEILNPYFGSKMLKCGEVLEKLEK